MEKLSFLLVFFLLHVTIFAQTVGTKVELIKDGNFTNGIGLHDSGSSNPSIIDTLCRELITDRNFLNGFYVNSQKDYANNFAFYKEGNFDYGNPNIVPVWAIDQWDSGPDLWVNRLFTDLGNGKYEYSDSNKSKWITIDTKAPSISLKLDAKPYYGDNARKEGQPWPHLLVEMGRFVNLETIPAEEAKFYKVGEMEKLVVSMDVKLTDFHDWMGAKANKKLHAAQFTMYLYVSDSLGDFIWFGLPIFDSRFPSSTEYLAIDGGKPDASGKMIYNLATKEYLGNKSFFKDGKPYPSNKSIHIQINVLPFIKRAFSIGVDKGWLKHTSANDLVVNGLNLGWEMPGTYKGEIVTKGLSVKSYILGKKSKLLPAVSQ